MAGCKPHSTYYTCKSSINLLKERSHSREAQNFMDVTWHDPIEATNEGWWLWSNKSQTSMLPSINPIYMTPGRDGLQHPIVR